MISICVWPDGTWCALEELHEYDWMSDDYEVKVITCVQYDAMC